MYKVPAYFYGVYLVSDVYSWYYIAQKTSCFEQLNCILSFVKKIKTISHKFL